MSQDVSFYTTAFYFKNQHAFCTIFKPNDIENALAAIYSDGSAK